MRLSRSLALSAGLALATAGTLAIAGPSPLAHAASTVVNGGFEADGTGTQHPTGWTVTSPNGTASAAYTEAGGHSGNYRLTEYSANAFDVDTWQTLTGLSNGAYTLTVWVRSSGGQNSADIGLSGCGSAAKQTALPVTADNMWLRIVVSTYVSGGRCTINLASNGNAGDWATFDDVTFTPGYAAVPIRGGDVSSLYRGVQDGGVYYNSAGGKEDALSILGSAGMNYARLRVWVNPEDGFDDEQQLLAEARQVAAHGMGLLLDFHYSDTWADPGHQTVPAAWANDTIAQLEAQVRSYSHQVVHDLVAQGTPPGMVATGNEINAGMLWPLGANSSSWTNFAGLLKAGIAGVKSADPATKIMLHIANAGDTSGAEWWYDNAVAQGVPFDVIGLSYYQYWHGPMDELQTTLDTLSARYDKPVIIAETAYPWTMANGDSTVNSVNSSNTTLPAGYPATPAGQQANFRDVISIEQAVPNGMGLGVFYWEPTWTVVPGNGWDPTDPTSGDGWENQAMFNFNDQALPVISDYAPR